MPDKLIQQCYKQSMKFQGYNRNQQRTLKKKSAMLLAYAETYPNAVIKYQSSDMVLNVYSDAAYLTMP